MNAELLAIAIPGLLTLIGVIYVQRNTRKVAQKAAEVEKGRAEDLQEVEIIKVKTEGDVKRVDTLLDTQMELIRELQIENRTQRKEAVEKDKLHREEMMQVRSDVAEITKLMNNCVEARQAQEVTVARLSAEVLDLKDRLAALQPPA